KLSLEHLGDLRPIAEVFEFRSGLNLAHHADIVSDADAGEDLPLLIEGRAVQRGNLAVELITHKARVDESRLIRAGDVLVRAIASPGDERLNVAELPPELAPACAASTVVVLTPRPGITDEQRRVAVQYLGSSLAMRVVRAMGTGGPNVA